MSKKKKQNLQKLIAKKQQLQQIAQGSVVSFQENSLIETFQKPEVAISPTTTYQPKATRDRALRKTAFSIVIIAILLVTAVIFDKKSPYLNQFGDWIYWALRLKS
ncbi:MAG: hypothetical protein NUV80_00285 [Candidatus Berkelbacteria bacterium]|nr:hypothetical protein [Candidatus Berkelbacteria bacterium]MCR4306986.1 hypothetical protein [Candidatus Berkelbacteria bacterium]